MKNKTVPLIVVCVIFLVAFGFLWRLSIQSNQKRTNLKLNARQLQTLVLLEPELEGIRNTGRISPAMAAELGVSHAFYCNKSEQAEEFLIFSFHDIDHLDFQLNFTTGDSGFRIKEETSSPLLRELEIK